MANNFNWFVILQGVADGRWVRQSKTKSDQTVIVGVFERAALLFNFLLW